jgi:hypothetical protein
MATTVDSPADAAIVRMALRSTERSAQTPTVILTSPEAPRDRGTAHRYAAYHYFRKPSGLTDCMKLGSIVRGVLSGQPRADYINPEDDAA